MRIPSRISLRGSPIASSSTAARSLIVVRGGAVSLAQSTAGAADAFSAWAVCPRRMLPDAGR
jgi:hypothetical protein